MLIGTTTAQRPRSKTATRSNPPYQDKKPTSSTGSDKNRSRKVSTSHRLDSSGPPEGFNASSVGFNACLVEINARPEWHIDASSSPPNPSACSIRTTSCMMRSRSLSASSRFILLGRLFRQSVLSICGLGFYASHAIAPCYTTKPLFRASNSLDC